MPGNMATAETEQSAVELKFGFLLVSCFFFASHLVDEMI